MRERSYSVVMHEFATLFALFTDIIPHLIVH